MEFFAIQILKWDILKNLLKKTAVIPKCKVDPAVALTTKKIVDNNNIYYLKQSRCHDWNRLVSRQTKILPSDRSLLHQHSKRVEGALPTPGRRRPTAEGMRDIIDIDKTTFSARPDAGLDIIIKNWK